MAIFETKHSDFGLLDSARKIELFYTLQLKHKSVYISSATMREAPFPEMLRRRLMMTTAMMRPMATVPKTPTSTATIITMLLLEADSDS